MDNGIFAHCLNCGNNGKQCGTCTYPDDASFPARYYEIRKKDDPAWSLRS
jgi:hypothetical protein